MEGRSGVEGGSGVRHTVRADFRPDGTAAIVRRRLGQVGAQPGQCVQLHVNVMNLLLEFLIQNI